MHSSNPPCPCLVLLSDPGAMPCSTLMQTTPHAERIGWTRHRRLSCVPCTNPSCCSAQCCGARARITRAALRSRPRCYIMAIIRTLQRTNATRGCPLPDAEVFYGICVQPQERKSARDTGHLSGARRDRKLLSIPLEQKGKSSLAVWTESKPGNTTSFCAYRLDLAGVIARRSQATVSIRRRRELSYVQVAF